MSDVVNCFELARLIREFHPKTKIGDLHSDEIEGLFPTFSLERLAEPIVSAFFMLDKERKFLEQLGLSHESLLIDVQKEHCHDF